MAKLWRSLLGRSAATESRSRLGNDYFNDFSPAAFAAFKSYYSGGGIGRDRDRETIENNFSSYVQSLFKSDGVVFACMVARQLVFSEARFQFRGFLNGRPQALHGGRELRPLERPWPNGTSGELLARMLGDVDLSGNAYIAREGERLRRLRPDWVQIIMTAPPDVAVQSDVAGYAYWPGGIDRGSPKFYLPEELAHWSPIPDPDANYRGMSCLTPIVAEIMADQAATQHKLGFFRNGATLGPVFRLGPDLSIEKFREFVAAAKAEHEGPENAYKPLYIGGGADMSLSAATMQQIDYRAITGAGETRIAAVLRISPVIVGLSEGMQGSSLNAGNYNAAKRNFVDGTMRPLWRSACGSLASVITEPADEQLWYDDFDIPYLREDAKDMAEIGSAKASTIVSLSTGGFLRESAIAAVENNYDMTLLVKDPDWVSVQLQSSSGSGGPGGGPDAPARGMLHADADVRAVRALPGRHRMEPDDDEPDDFADLDDAELDDDEQALVDALQMIAESNGVDLYGETGRSWDPSLHPRGPDGKFISAGALLRDAINIHLTGGGPDPFASYNRDRLRRVARRMGVTLPRGASHDYIRQALLHHVGAGMTPAVHVPQPVHVPTPRLPRSPGVPGPRSTRAKRIADALDAVGKPNPITDTMDKVDRLTDTDFATLSGPDQNKILDKLNDINAHALRRQDSQRAQDVYDRLVQVTPGTAAPAPVGTAMPIAMPVFISSPNRTVRASNALFLMRDANVTDPSKLASAGQMTPSDWASLSVADQDWMLAHLSSHQWGSHQSQADRVHAQLAGYPTAAPAAKLPTAPGVPGVYDPAQQARIRDALAAANGALSGAVKLDELEKLSRADFDAMDGSSQHVVMDVLDDIYGYHVDPAQRLRARDLLDRFDPNHRATVPSNAIHLAPGSRAPFAQARYAQALLPTVATDAEKLDAIDAIDPYDFNNLPSPERKTLMDYLTGVYATSADPALVQRAADIMDKHDPLARLLTNVGTLPGGAPANPNPHMQTPITPVSGRANRGTRQGNALAASSNSMMSDAERNTHIGHLHKADYDAMTARDQQQILAGLHATAQFAPGRKDRDRAKKLIDRFTPAGTPLGTMPTPSAQIAGPANPHQTILPAPQGGLLVQATNSGQRGDEWLYTPDHKSRVWGKYGSGGLLLRHVDASGTERFLMTQRGPAISDPGVWSYPGGAFESKENFYQGATREVAEELGWTDADFAGAQVHGYHVLERSDINAVDAKGNPTPWTYHSVAATVPTMMTPHLQTHNARMETSDAKWMTRAEIDALDKAGKLHHPVAGGKLQTNVMSIFPSTTAGNGAPSAPPRPATPHKPSKGRNLVSDNGAQDKLRSDVSATRRSYRGKTADERLAAIGAMQGYDETPTVVKRSEFDRLLATGDYIEAWRGVQSAGGWGTPTKSAASIHEDMRSGPAYYGTGIFGNGYYLTTQQSVARMYSDGSKNSVVRILIPKSAKIEGFDSVHKRARATGSSSSKHFSGSRQGDTGGVGTLRDPGRYAAAEGLDGIEISSHHHSPGGGAVHIARPGKPAYNWVNRSVLIIQEAD
jgi:phage portal protein BeeE/ADP-ribose pyrophosphatase YjhB (NUDIX family)